MFIVNHRQPENKSIGLENKQMQDGKILNQRNCCTHFWLVRAFQSSNQSAWSFVSPIGCIEIWSDDLKRSGTLHTVAPSRPPRRGPPPWPLP